MTGVARASNSCNGPLAGVGRASNPRGGTWTGGDMDGVGRPGWGGDWGGGGRPGGGGVGGWGGGREWGSRGGVELYDRIGRTYGVTRRADPRIAAAVSDALGDVASVVNVGAGAGSYEPEQTIVAVEPSLVMIAQRPAGSAPVVRAVAERLALG